MAYGENDEHESDHAKVLKRQRGKGKPNPRVRACVVLVGLQLTSVQQTEIVLSCSTAKTSTKPVIVPVESPSQSSV